MGRGGRHCRNKSDFKNGYTQFSRTSATSGGQRDWHFGHQVKDAMLRLMSQAELISAFCTAILLLHLAALPKSVSTSGW